MSSTSMSLKTIAEKKMGGDIMRNLTEACGFLFCSVIYRCMASGVLDVIELHSTKCLGRIQSHGFYLCER